MFRNGEGAFVGLGSMQRGKGFGVNDFGCILRN